MVLERGIKAYFKIMCPDGTVIEDEFGFMANPIDIVGPGRIYVLATLLPLATFVLLIVGGAIRALVRPYRNTHQSAQFVFFLFGGGRSDYRNPLL